MLLFYLLIAGALLLLGMLGGADGLFIALLSIGVLGVGLALSGHL